MDETPLETARRVWPGNWDHRPDGDLYRCLFCSPIGILGVKVCKPWDARSNDWTAYFYVQSKPSFGEELWSGSLEVVLLHSRRLVQTMAQDFARAAGVT